MEKAIRYIDTFWGWFYVYMHDGSYLIDNSIAKRFIRRTTSERITCFSEAIRWLRFQQYISILNYFKKLFSEIVKGCREYKHLLPLIIGLNE